MLRHTYGWIATRHFSPFQFPHAGNDNEAPPPEKRYN